MYLNQMILKNHLVKYLTFNYRLILHFTEGFILYSQILIKESLNQKIYLSRC